MGWEDVVKIDAMKKQKITPPKGAETMKCTVCRGPAVIRMPRHNAHFCEEHFLSHVRKQLKKTISHYRMFSPSERILLGVSGGKDSMAAWDLLLEAGYRPDALFLNTGFGDFSRASEEAVRSYAADRKVPLRIVSIQELFGVSFEDLVELSKSPACSICGMVKRYLLNRSALEGGYSALATGHNLDDESAFLLGNLLHGQVNYLKRQQPVLEEAQGLSRKVKPLVKLSDRDMKLYVQLRDIPNHPGLCPHSQGAVSHIHKEILQTIDDTFPGTKGSFYTQYVEKIRPLIEAGLSQQGSPGSPGPGHCSRCSYPTMRDGLCQYCSLEDAVRKARS